MFDGSLSEKNDNTGHDISAQYFASLTSYKGDRNNPSLSLYWNNAESRFFLFSYDLHIRLNHKTFLVGKMKKGCINASFHFSGPFPELVDSDKVTHPARSFGRLCFSDCDIKQKSDGKEES